MRRIEPLTPQTERMFVESFTACHARYRASLSALRAGSLALGDKDLDTGNRSTHGANPLADETYADLLKKFAERKFAGVPQALRHDINEYYASRSADASRVLSRKVRKQDRDAARRLTGLNATVLQGQ